MLGSGGDRREEAFKMRDGMSCGSERAQYAEYQLCEEGYFSFFKNNLELN